MKHSTRHVDIVILGNESPLTIAHQLAEAIDRDLGKASIPTASRDGWTPNARVTITVQPLTEIQSHE